MHDKQALRRVNESHMRPTVTGEVKEIIGQIFNEYHRSRSRAQKEGAFIAGLVFLVLFLLFG